MIFLPRQVATHLWLIVSGEVVGRFSVVNYKGDLDFLRVSSWLDQSEQVGICVVRMLADQIASSKMFSLFAGSGTVSKGVW